MATSTDGTMMDISSPAIAFDIEVAESYGSTFSVPKRVRRRLEQSPEAKSPASLEDIETKLKDADSRRQQFHEWLANKAKPKRKADQTSSPLPNELAERLEARLCAAEQKRLDLLAQEQTRLAKLHELRMAAKTEAQLRAEREREELGTKVESRVQQAETNRMALVEAEKQRRAAANERIAQSIVQRTTLEDKDREKAEALRVAIGQKIAAAEEKRACLLEAEKNRAQATVTQARKVAEAVLRERELELMNKKEKLEARLLRAKRQRAEYLRQKGGCRGSCHNHGHKMHKHGDRLCRKLTRCWRQFRVSMKTTYALAQEFSGSGINQRTVTSLPFEQLADRITSPAALRSVKALLARIESRLMLSAATESSEVAKIDALLKRLSPPQRKPAASRVGKRGGAQAPGKASIKSKEPSKQDDLERYPARVFLCAYMIFGHPDAVFSARGDREAALAEAAAKLLPEFEALVSTVIDRPTPSSPPSTPPPAAESYIDPQHKPFAAQLASFDTAWHSYLCRFVAWKVKDAQLLEEDLIRVACQLEVSMLQKCGTDSSGLTHDAQAIRKQVLEDQRLLRDRIVHLTGKTGLGKMEEALATVRSKFVEAKENGVPLPSPFAYSSPEDLRTVPESPESEGSGSGSKDDQSKPKAARALFTASIPNPGSEAAPELMNLDPAADLHNSGMTNEKMVNELMHDGTWKIPEQMNAPGSFEAQFRNTFERAFWDNVEANLLKDAADYRQVVSLVGEIRDDLENIAPEAWKQGIRESLDVEILSQVLESGINDFKYLRNLLDYTLDVILRLNAPARDKESQSALKALTEELTAATTDGGTKESYSKAVVKGIRFVFEQLQVLKKDISNVKLQSLAQLISGSSGLDYLRQAFVERYDLNSSTTDDRIFEKLPQTLQWIRSSQSSMDSHRSEIDAALTSVQSIAPAAAAPRAFPMCTGGRVVVSGTSSNSSRQKIAAPGPELAAIRWGSTEAAVRLGLLSIISGSEAASEKTVPETLILNINRLRDCQNDFQRIVVMATGLLLLRQELMTKIHGPDLEMILIEASKELERLLNEPTASVIQIGSLLAKVCAKKCEQHYPDVSACAALMARVLERSLSSGDAVFERVVAAIRSSLKAVLVLGNGGDGAAVAEAALKRIGGGMFLAEISGIAWKIEKMSGVTIKVHGGWYARI